MREERRRFRYARRACGIGRRVVVGLKRTENRMRRRRTGGERRQQIAERAGARLILVRMAAGEVDELAARVDVLDRVLQRRLPRDKQHRRKRNPRNAE